MGALSFPNGPFTVFAPTDDAFASLPEGLVTCLLKTDNKDTLADILKYHVVSGKVMSTDLSNGVKINESTVTTPDVETSNGVIHIIDSVLVPADVDVSAFLATCSDSTPAPTDSTSASASLLLNRFSQIGALAIVSLFM